MDKVISTRPVPGFRSSGKRTGIAINHVGKYLSRLLDLGFIRRVISTDVADHSNTLRSRYELKDAYHKFFFHYVYPNLESLEQ